MSLFVAASGDAGYKDGFVVFVALSLACIGIVFVLQRAGRLSRAGTRTASN